MAYKKSKRKRVAEMDQAPRQRKSSIDLEAVPNSASYVMRGHGKGSLPNSAMNDMVSDRASAAGRGDLAEQEADRLSAAVTSTTPETLRQEMGRRLGADFSGVRFHTDERSAGQADHMGASAYAQGGDVYFGDGGFNPKVAAHELVHTVQQGAVDGAVSQSVPMGTVQMWPWGKKETEEEKRQRRLDKLFRIQAGLSYGDKKSVSKEDRKWYEKKLKNADASLIRAILDRRNEEADDLDSVRRSLGSQANGLDKKEDDDKLDFMAQGTNHAYNMNIYHMLASKMKKNKNYKEAWRAHDKSNDDKYESMTKVLRNRNYKNSDAGKIDAGKRLDAYKGRSKFIYENYDRVATDSDNLLVDWADRNKRINGGGLGRIEEPRGRKKAYEMSARELRDDKFNPGKVEELSKVQEKIENEQTAAGAFRAFSEFAGNSEARLSDGISDWDLSHVDLDAFKAKLKHMSRVISDYPELRGMIGDFIPVPFEAESATTMQTSSTYGGRERAIISYNSYMDRKGPEGERERAETERSRLAEGKKAYSIASADYTGVHELGHVLNSLLVKDLSEDEALEDWNKRITSDAMVKEVLAKVLPQKELAKMKRETHSSSRHKIGHLNIPSAKLNERGLTSGYGATNPADFFAEAFADVYQNGKNARPASIELVKLYEKKRDEMIRRMNRAKA